MNKYMQAAKELSENNLKTKVGGPFGTVVVKNGEIIGRGSNHVIGKNDPTAHAEVEAIRDACKNLKTYDLSGCIIYTSSYPCPMCLSAAIWSNIKEIYYGNTKEDTDDIGFRDDFIYEYIKNMDDKTLKLECLDREETLKVYEEYKNMKDRVKY